MNTTALPTDRALATRNLARKLARSRSALVEAFCTPAARPTLLALARAFIGGTIARSELWHTFTEDEAADAANASSSPARDAAIALSVALERALASEHAAVQLPGAFHARVIRRYTAQLRPDARTATHFLAQLGECVAGSERDAIRAAVNDALRALSVTEAALFAEHAPLSQWLANRFVGRGIGLEDLLQEARTGLLRAIRRYDPGVGAEFSTYAQHWIRAALERAVANDARLIRLPVHLHERVNRLARSLRTLETRLRRRPTEEELAAELRISLEDVRVVTNAIRLGDLACLSASAGDDDTATLEAFLPDPSTPPPDAAIRMDQERRKLRECLEQLSDRERAVIAQRFGLDNQDERTLAEIGDDYGVTRERIRQLESRALERLERLLRFSRTR